VPVDTIKPKCPEDFAAVLSSHSTVYYCSLLLQFLDFFQLPTYHPNAFFNSIGPVTPNATLEIGTKIRCVIEGMTFTSNILVRLLFPIHIFQQ
jgi:hypothetical protein